MLVDANELDGLKRIARKEARDSRTWRGGRVVVRGHRFIVKCLWIDGCFQYLWIGEPNSINQRSDWVDRSWVAGVIRAQRQLREALTPHQWGN